MFLFFRYIFYMDRKVVNLVVYVDMGIKSNFLIFLEILSIFFDFFCQNSDGVYRSGIEGLREIVKEKVDEYF